jgi:cytochrome c
MNNWKSPVQMSRSMFSRSFLCQTLATLMLVSPALAASPEQRGKVYARTHCGRCHAIGRTGQSPLDAAPAFRTLHLHYAIETLGEALAEGISTGHPTMPETALRPDQIHDLLSFLKSLE